LSKVASLPSVGSELVDALRATFPSNLTTPLLCSLLSSTTPTGCGHQAPSRVCAARAVAPASTAPKRYLAREVFIAPANYTKAPGPRGRSDPDDLGSNGVYGLFTDPGVVGACSLPSRAVIWRCGWWGRDHSSCSRTCSESRWANMVAIVAATTARDPLGDYPGALAIAGATEPGLAVGGVEKHVGKCR
jgi:hypothetical protein